MNKYLQDILKTKNDFELNNETQKESFPLTQSVLSNFKESFKTNAVALVALIGLSTAAVGADFQPVDSIQKVYEESLSISNIYYKDSLPTYIESKEKLKESEKDTILKNDFWENNIVTLVVGDADDDIVNEVDKEKYKLQLKVLAASVIGNDVSGGAQFIKKYSDQEKVDSIYSGKNDYKYFFKADHDGIAVQMFTNYVSEENKKYMQDFITFHEMCHASYEQEISSINKHATFDLSDIVSYEAHSDVAALLMIGKKHHLSTKELVSVIHDIASFRANNRLERGDTGHNSAIILTELENLIKNNPKVYEDMNPKKISSFSAYFVNNLNSNFNKKVIAPTLERVGLNIDILGIKEHTKIIQAELKQLVDTSSPDKTLAFLTPDAVKVAVYNEVMTAYIYRLPMDKQKEVIATFQESRNAELLSDIMKASRKITEINSNFIRDFTKMTDKELDSYAVIVSKKFNNLSLSNYSDTITLLGRSDKLEQIYPYNTLKDQFKNTTVLKAKINSDLVKND